jgi:hypothetical protein
MFKDAGNMMTEQSEQQWVLTAVYLNTGQVSGGLAAG